MNKANDDSNGGIRRRGAAALMCALTAGQRGRIATEAVKDAPWP